MLWLLSCAPGCGILEGWQIGNISQSLPVLMRGALGAVARECAGERLEVVAGVVRQDVQQGVLHDGR